MQRFIFRFLGFLVLVYIGLCVVMYFAQRSLIYYPVKLSHANDANSIKLEVPQTTLVITTSQTEAEDAIVYFGGNAEDVSLSLPQLKQAFPNRAIFMMHYRSYGGSTGQASEANLFADAVSMFDMVKSKHRQIMIVGRSLGSGVASFLASKRQAEKLILITPFYSLENVAWSQYPYLPVNILLIDKFESYKYVPQIDTPTLLIVAEWDQLTPMDGSLALQKKFKPGLSKMVVIKRAWHNGISNSPDYLNALRTTF